MDGRPVLEADVERGVVPRPQGLMTKEEHVPVFPPVVVCLFNRSPTCRNNLKSVYYVIINGHKKEEEANASSFRNRKTEYLLTFDFVLVF